ncbi:VOC family protein [Catenuloplanes indicus]|uniref:Glyoxalase-like domain-containing protein n=1 Tax=Catenuloplanes indicus TaxID=137267 RepID=A0AAE3VUU0_9ACTN|nr:VOC family protein [Catenuloplanes indicus]MDQ0364603.1 hypothetical protein [Catenuloplanes indicus]
MRAVVDGLHHVGLVVPDLGAAIETYRRLGFTVAPPVCPALPPAPGAPPRPIGAANSHVYLDRSFVELVTVVDDHHPLPDDAEARPIEVPDDRLPALLAAARAAAAGLTAWLGRGPGLRILMLGAPDVHAAAARLDAAGIGHGGVHPIQRRIPGGMATSHFLELDNGDRAVADPGAGDHGDDRGDGERTTRGGSGRGGSAPSGHSASDPGGDRGGDRGDGAEGRIGIAESIAAGEHPVGHPNGATALTGCTLRVPRDAFPGVVSRYERLVGRPAERADGVARLRAGDATVTLLLGHSLMFSAVTVAVHDLRHTARHLAAAHVPHTAPRPGEIVVPAAAALGAAIVFREPEARTHPDPAASEARPAHDSLRRAG